MEKAALKRNTMISFLIKLIREIVVLKYKQALRGLFIAGTSPPLLAETTEKVGDEPGLNPPYGGCLV